MLAVFAALSTMNPRSDERGTTPTETRAAKRQRKLKHASPKKQPTRVYSKSALSPEEILERVKSKGLIIQDHESALKAIKSIGYFRLLIYMRNFQESSDTGKRFRQGTLFEEVISLYEFDRRIRLLTLDAIERLEVALRASLSNALTTETPDAHWYLQKKHYHKQEPDTQNKNSRQQKPDFHAIKQQIEKSAGRDALKDGKKGVALQHYYDTYKKPTLPPIWLACEKLSLGALSKFLSSLSTGNRKLVARHLWQDYPERLLCSWFQSLTDLRNICAHQDRVWDTSFTVNSPAAHKDYPDDFGEETQKRFYSRAAVIQLLLRPLGNHAFWKEGLLSLLRSCSHVEPKAHLGFPDNWQERPLWTEDAVLDSKVDDK